MKLKVLYENKTDVLGLVKEYLNSVGIRARVDYGEVTSQKFSIQPHLDDPTALTVYARAPKRFNEELDEVGSVDLHEPESLENLAGLVKQTKSWWFHKLKPIIEIEKELNQFNLKLGGRFSRLEAVDPNDIPRFTINHDDIGVQIHCARCNAEEDFDWGDIHDIDRFARSHLAFC